MNRTNARATVRWLVPIAALGNMVTTINSADQEGWSLSTVVSAITTLCFAVMAGAFWAHKF